MKKKLAILTGVLTVMTACTVGVIAGTNITSTGSLAANSVGRYEGHDKLECQYDDDTLGKMKFYYSDGLFENNPREYDHHMATFSMSLVNASDSYVINGDYSDGAKRLKQAYTDMGYQNTYVSDSYQTKPTTDSIGYVISSKPVYLTRLGKDVDVISVTIRSAGYELEWASNVKLGASGEAEGFREAAKQVKDGVDAYIENQGYADAIANGNIVFHLQGYSRGGATASLTAKRLIDDYQSQGNEVVAYCFEAPQGGVASAEVDGRDYCSIHNVINVDDLVPYVAPSCMGFKRYGVDHYIYDETHDSNNLIVSTQFPNNVADNKPVAVASKGYYKEVVMQISNMITNRSKRAKYRPYEMIMYQLTLPSFDIDMMDTEERTSSILKRFMDGLAGTTTRSEYANDGLQKALRNLLIYKEGGPGLGTITDAFGTWDIPGLVKDAIVPTLITAVGSGVAAIVDGIIETFGGEPVVAKYLNKEFLKELASIVSNRILMKSDLVSSLDKYYPGKKEAAVKDLYTIVYHALNALPGINDIITLANGISGVMNNHSSIQSIAYLRAIDTWYSDYPRR